MELKDKGTHASDDEDDLEKLRLAALQSLKRPTAPLTTQFLRNKKSPQGLHKRRNFLGRNRNGVFHNRSKNTNLISIPTIDDTVPEQTNQRKVFTEDKDVHKLILPQDRYCNVKNSEEKSQEATSKFDRYDNSDKSDSESEYESEAESEIDQPIKLERANSLEALMQELENEIQGDAKPKEDKPIKNKIKKRKKKISEKMEVSNSVKKQKEVLEIKETVDKEEKVVENGVLEIIETMKAAPLKKGDKEASSNSPIERKHPPINLRRRNFRNYNGNKNFQSCHNQFHPLPCQPMALYNPPLFSPVPFHPLVSLPHPTVGRQFYDLPLSPLTLNTNEVSTITRPPLSPRSAAFVLQNKDAIERRKKSPRRSYSRSPSPRYRRSKSLSLSPKFIKSRSRTPVKDERRSPIRDRSPARDRSPLRNRRISPNRRRSIDRKPSPETRRCKLPIRARLGKNLKPAKRSRSKSPINPEKVKVAKIEQDLIDPVLEARRKKFESNEIKNKEGIIRLKPKIEEPTQKLPEKNEQKEEKTESDLLEDEEIIDENLEDILNAKVDDIFSDEETDEENEGRFKTALQNNNRNVAVLPFTKLLDSKIAQIDEPLISNSRRDRIDCERESRRRSRSPLRSRDGRINKPSDKSDITRKDNRRTHKERLRARGKVTKRDKVPVTSPIENKKIEIKIRNPSKYETTSKYDVANEHDTRERLEKTSRKVEVSKKNDLEEIDDLEPDIIIDNDDDQFNQKCDDLRAQLSRKRAERQNRLPVAEDVQSRLLQNALQGAVFKKQKKIQVEKKSGQKDGKRPIHMRLGFANGDGVFQESKKKKAGKSMVTGKQV